jgi:ABC-2 family transporter
MTWLTWRQFRTQATAIFILVGALAVVLAVTGPHLFAQYPTQDADFLDVINTEVINTVGYLAGIAVLYVLPGLIGAFWGAPLIARELEAGTHRLVWNQSVTRTRWLGVKLSLIGLAAVVTAGLAGLAVSWWSDPIDQSIAKGEHAGSFILPRLHPVIFGARGIVPIGYTVFALALGVALGLVLRRIVPAIALTLVVVVAVQVAVPLLVRSHLAETARQVSVITTDNYTAVMITGNQGAVTTQMNLKVDLGAPGDWIVSNRTIDASGQVTDKLPSWLADCGDPLPAASHQPNPPSAETCFTRFADAGYRQQASYHPAANFWTLQWRETALLLVLALLLTAFTFWRIHRDVT